MLSLRRASELSCIGVLILAHNAGGQDKAMEYWLLACLTFSAFMFAATVSNSDKVGLKKDGAFGHRSLEAVIYHCGLAHTQRYGASDGPQLGRSCTFFFQIQVRR